MNCFPHQIGKKFISLLLDRMGESMEGHLLFLEGGLTICITNKQ